MSKLQLNPNIEPFARVDRQLSPEDVRQLEGVDKVYPMANNENPLGPSPRVIEAIEAAAPTLSYYPEYSDLR